MIKVIKHGQTEFTMNCSRCGCEFTYEHEDIQYEALKGLANYATSKYVDCPDCHAKCYIFNINWEPNPNTSTPPFNTPSGTSACQDCDWWKKITQPGGFTYVGDTPCTWCDKGLYKVINDTKGWQTIAQYDNEQQKSYTLCNQSTTAKMNVSVEGEITNE